MEIIKTLIDVFMFSSSIAFFVALLWFGLFSIPIGSESERATARAHSFEIALKLFAFLFFGILISKLLGQ